MSARARFEVAMVAWLNTRFAAKGIVVTANTPLFTKGLIDSLGILELIAWTDADFIQTLRTGVALSGHPLNPKFMPWPYKGRMTDDELKAIFLYLQSLPKLPTSTASAP